jgi:hypothetical protein
MFPANGFCGILPQCFPLRLSKNIYSKYVMEGEVVH